MSDGAPVIATVKIEQYSKNSGKLINTVEEKLLLQDEGEVSKLDLLLSLLQGEWDEYSITTSPATCGDCKHCGFEGDKKDINVNDTLTCPYAAGTHTDSPACQFFKLRQ